MAAPFKVLSRKLEIAFRDEDWRLINQLSVLANGAKAAAVRASSASARRRYVTARCLNTGPTSSPARSARGSSS